MLSLRSEHKVSYNLDIQNHLIYTNHIDLKKDLQKISKSSFNYQILIINYQLLIIIAG